MGKRLKRSHFKKPSTKSDNQKGMNNYVSDRDNK